MAYQYGKSPDRPYIAIAGPHFPGLSQMLEGWFESVLAVL